MKIRYKLTDSNGYTRRYKSGETLWKKGTVRKTSGKGDLCDAGWTHVYTHPPLAEMFDQIHGQYGASAKLISVFVGGKSKTDHGTKEGWTVVKFRRREKRRKVKLVHKIAFGILAAKEVFSDPAWSKWADDWLAGRDRTQAAARAAGDAAWAAARAAGDAAVRADLINLLKIARKAMKVKP